MKGFKRLAVFATVLAMVIASLNTELYAVSSQNTNAAPITERDSISKSDYFSYIEKNTYENATESTELAINSEVKLSKNSPVSFDFLCNRDAVYNIEVMFSPLDSISEHYEFSLKIDGQAPFDECEELSLFPLWQDDGEIRTLTNGDQVSPLQKHMDGFYSQRLFDDEGIELYPYKFIIPAGAHTLTLESVGKDFLISKITLCPVEKIETYSEVSKKYTDFENYDGEQIAIEAEKPFSKNAYSLSSKSEQSSADVSPSSPVNAVINYIGGTTWNTAGSSISWKFTAPKDGLYKLGISFKQSYVTDGEVYRYLKIDGKTPFIEAAGIGFPYASKWQFKELKTEDNEDMLFYLTKGEHTLSMDVTLSDTSKVFKRLENIVEPLGNLYLDIVMITGENPDKNRDYELHKQIPDFEKTLNDAYKNIDELSKDINSTLKVNGELNGALKNMARIIKEMTENIYDAHLYVTTYYSAQQTLSAWLYDIKNMSLAIDEIILSSPDKEIKAPTANVWEKLVYSLKRYAYSYVSNTSMTKSSTDDTLPSIKIWVNWGRDQVKVLNSLIQDSFTPQNKVNVTVEQVNATLVQGVISGNSPDLYLHMARTEPVNLAMRGVLYNLENFPDFEEVLKTNCYSGGETPYVYNGGTYALPDTQNFFVMFYRKDILEKLGLSVPNTWDEFLSVTGILQRNKMNTYLPYTKLGAAGTVNIGAGGLTIFPTMLMQKGGSVYNDKQNATNLADKSSVEAFKFWTEFYTEYSLDQDANFYQKFRVGTIPLGIASYTQYLNLRIGAPEIYGKWGIAEIPGIKAEDGKLNRVCAGSGTGVSVMKSSKNLDAAWKFVKWWISADTQYRYSADVEAIIGETGRVCSANKDAVSRLSWDTEALDVILSQWENVKEVPEVPGSYYVSRSIDQAFWATKNGKKSAKESIMDWSVVSDNEIKRKIKEYAGNKEG